MSRKDRPVIEIPAYTARQLYLLDLIGERGACNTLPKVKTYRHDPFFPPKGGSFTEAEAICAVCPVLKECVEFAFETEQEGFWGGMTEKERNAMRGAA